MDTRLLFFVLVLGFCFSCEGMQNGLCVVSYSPSINNDLVINITQLKRDAITNQKEVLDELRSYITNKQNDLLKTKLESKIINVSEQDSKGFTPFQIAALHNNSQAFELLLKYDPNPDFESMWSAYKLADDEDFKKKVIKMIDQKEVEEYGLCIIL
jgi:ankyrin repeat protein